MNIVSIDPSLISTAVVVNGKIINYCRESDAMNKSGFAKWYRFCEQYVEYKFIEYHKYNNYSEGEVTKLIDYDTITSSIVDDILVNIDINLPTKVGIEGYSYSSDVGAIIDLVTFSTLLRRKLHERVSKDIIIYSPKSLKLEACKLTYKPINEGKKKDKWVYKNNDGISGGSFTKHAMYLALIENNRLTDGYVNLCRNLKSEVFSSSKVPKPIEDINDAKLIYHIIKGDVAY